jgi:hypothetical protein
MVKSRPEALMRRWMEATSLETEGEAVPSWGVLALSGGLDRSKDEHGHVWKFEDNMVCNHVFKGEHTGMRQKSAMHFSGRGMLA